MACDSSGDGGNRSGVSTAAAREEAVYLKPLVLGVFPVPVAILVLFFDYVHQPDAGLLVLAILAFGFLLSPFFTTIAFSIFNGSVWEPLRNGSLVTALTYCVVTAVLLPELILGAILLFPFLLVLHLLLSYGLFRLMRLTR